MKVVSDTEANGLESPDKIWCTVFRDIDNPDKYEVFERPDEKYRNFNKYTEECDFIAGHNFIGYDYRVLSKLIPYFRYPTDNIIDTLVISRLLNFRIEGGHSIAAWAERFGKAKVGKEIEDWSIYTPKMLERCINDTLVNVELIHEFLPIIYDPKWSSALRTEHDTQWLCEELHENGFPFKKQEAEKLRERVAKQLEVLDNELKTAFPLKFKPVRVISPRLTANGNLHRGDFRFLGPTPDLTGYSPDAPFTLIEPEEFNPGSVKQIVERLNEAGWRPKERTKTHNEALKEKGPGRDLERLSRLKEYGWKISEENLRTLPESAPEAARKLVERLLLSSRVSDLDEWIGLSRPFIIDSKQYERIQGQFNGIGAWTQRMSHSKPNMGNTPIPQHKDNPSYLDKLSDDINTEMRNLWYAPDGYRLIGTDADGIQMRIFAHYVNDLRLIKALIEGDKKNETDIHSLHKRALGQACKGRNPAKTFIYAWLLGAGIAKVAEILECSLQEAGDAIDSFVGFYPGLAYIKENRIPYDYARGYFEGLDKRLVTCYSEHTILGGYLQNGETVVMKRASIQWNKQLKKEHIPYWMVNFVHDEWQTITPDDDDIANYVAEVQQQSIVDQGIQLELNCPLGANSKFGRTWMDTH